MLDFGSFLMMLGSNPVLLVILVLTLGATVVNGATDAPNAIAPAVSTRSMGPGPAIIMAAICNFIGLIIITAISSAVAQTIFNMVDFGGQRPSSAPCARGRYGGDHRVGRCGLGSSVFPHRRAILSLLDLRARLSLCRVV